MAGEILQAHEYADRAAQPGDRRPVHERCRVTGRQVAGDDDDLVRHAPMSHRDAGRRRHGEGAGHPGHHGHRNARGRTGQHLFAAAAEHVRVAALEPDDGVPGPGPVDQDLVDLVLGFCGPYGSFDASTTSTFGPSSSSRSPGARWSTTTTVAVAISRRPFTVISSGSPGPAPTSRARVWELPLIKSFCIEIAEYRRNKKLVVKRRNLRSMGASAKDLVQGRKY